MVESLSVGWLSSISPCIFIGLGSTFFLWDLQMTNIDIVKIEMTYKLDS